MIKNEANWDRGLRIVLGATTRSIEGHGKTAAR